MNLGCSITRIPFEVSNLFVPMSQWTISQWWFLELINLVRHIKAYPNDSLGTSLRNVFDFDIYRPETIDKLAQILVHHG